MNTEKKSLLQYPRFMTFIEDYVSERGVKFTKGQVITGEMYYLFVKYEHEIGKTLETIPVRYFKRDVFMYSLAVRLTKDYVSKDTGIVLKAGSVVVGIPTPCAIEVCLGEGIYELVHARYFSMVDPIVPVSWHIDAEDNKNWKVYD